MSPAALFAEMVSLAHLIGPESEAASDAFGGSGDPPPEDGSGGGNPAGEVRGWHTAGPKKAAPAAWQRGSPGANWQSSSPQMWQDEEHADDIRKGSRGRGPRGRGGGRSTRKGPSAAVDNDDLADFDDLDLEGDDQDDVALASNFSLIDANQGEAYDNI